MDFKLKLELVSLSYLSHFNSKFYIQDEFWNLEIKSFHLALRFMGLYALLMEKSPSKDSTEVLNSLLYLYPNVNLSTASLVLMREQTLQLYYNHES